MFQATAVVRQTARTELRQAHRCTVRLINEATTKFLALLLRAHRCTKRLIKKILEKGKSQSVARAVCRDCTPLPDTWQDRAFWTCRCCSGLVVCPGGGENKRDTIQNLMDSIPNDSKCWRWESQITAFYGEPHLPDDGSDTGWMAMATDKTSWKDDLGNFVADSVLTSH